MDFVFDPRDLISPPFVACPRCGEQQFGVNVVGAQSYSRWCRACGDRGERVPLPALSRKVVYVDQFAISNMMKALNRAHSHHAKAAADPFWRQLFERLDRLVQLQLVICPFSEVHINESVVSPDGETLRDIYERLSLMVGFDFMGPIVARQLRAAVVAWLENRVPEYDLSARAGTRGGLNDWRGFPLISARGGYPQNVIAAIRTFRDEVRQKISVLFEELTQEGRGQPFKYWFERERAVSGAAVLHAEQLAIDRLRQIAGGRADRPYNSAALKRFLLIEETLEEHGVPDEELLGRIRAFLDSKAYKDYPANRITALAWAAVDRAVADGQKNLSYAGMSNDIQMLTLMPFCDAMLIDNGCRAMWQKVPLDLRRCYERTRLFSYNLKEKFMEYLTEIETQADPTILTPAREVYGEPEPFVAMYDR